MRNQSLSRRCLLLKPISTRCCSRRAENTATMDLVYAILLVVFVAGSLSLFVLVVALAWDNVELLLQKLHRLRAKDLTVRQ